MIPLRDTTRSKTIPFVNYTLIAVCGLVFLSELSMGSGIEHLIRTLGLIPFRVMRLVRFDDPSVSALLPLLTSMFLHGGWVHLLGNMLYLYIFGDNVEDRLGHGAYLVFFLLSGIGAALVEVFARPSSTAPLIGASGAIAGVLGAYFLLYPSARVLTLIPLIIFFPLIEVPAFVFLGFWFLMQFWQGSASVGVDAAGGIAWWAHAGGFVVGILLLPILLTLKRRR